MNRARILIVEDEVIVAMDIQTRLAGHGYGVTGTAVSGEQALALAEQQRPDLVLMDIRLKGALDGIQTAALLRDRFQVPVVFLTAYAEDGTLQRAKGADPFGYILKPFEDRELTTIIEMALYKHQAGLEIRRLNRLYAVLSQVNQTIVRAQTSAELFHQVCRVAVESGEFRLAWIGEHDAQTHAINPVAQFGDHDDYVGRIGAVSDDQPQGRGPTGTAVRENKPFVCNDVFENPHMLPWRQAADGLGFLAVAGFPIRKNGLVWGALTLYARERDYFQDAEVQLLEQVTTDVSFALEQMAVAVQRDQAEEMLRRNEQGFRALIENASDIISLVDAKGIIRYESPSITHILGYQPAELVGRSVFELIHPDDRAAIEETFRQGIQVPGLNVRLELRFRHRDGSWRFLESVSKNLLADEALHGIIVHSRDITERKQAEQELRETNQQLAEALADLQTAQQEVVQRERLRALGTMASGVAHDFNNALATILGFTELMLHRSDVLEQKDKALHFLQMIHTAAKDAGQVVNRLREFYRHRDAGEVFGAVDLNQLVTETVSLTRPKWQSQAQAHGVNIQVKTELADLPLLAGNAAELRESLANLLFNAVDAMPQGGVITIRSRRDDPEVVLEVADTGLGMTDEVRRRCLEPFFTTKGQQGTGLGLSVVYGIVTRHQGTVTIDTKLGQGTTVILRFPMARAAAAPVLPAPVQAGATIPPLKVLVVDDEPCICDILREFLVGGGHQVQTATDGQTALTKSAQGRFDVALVDRAMPGMSGDQLAVLLKQANPGLALIMLTGFGAMMEAAGEKPAGVDLVLGKPVGLAELFEALAKVMAQRPAGAPRV